MVPQMQATHPSKNLNPNPTKTYLRFRRSLKKLDRVAVILSAAVWLALAPFVSAQAPACSPIVGDTPTPNTPLNDLGKNTYSNPNSTATPAQGGLYPNGYNQRPNPYNAVGINLTTDPNGIVPRDTTGKPDNTSGKIVMISIGMCNSSMEFGGTLDGTTAHDGFQCRVMGNKHPDNNMNCSSAPCDLAAGNWKNPKLFVWDCAQSGQDAKDWACPTAAACPTASPFPNQNPWDQLDCRLTAAGLSKKQVQVVWLKEALAQPSLYGGWPEHVNQLQTYLEQILGHLVDPAYGFVDPHNVPTVKMVFLSPRTRAWTNGTISPHSPEPYAYETGFADKWLIQEKIQGAHPEWPWLCWGPYTWVDGDRPRSDGQTWGSSYLKPDCTHPLSSTGVHTVADQLLAFFKTDPVARPWFLKSTTSAFTVSVTTNDPDHNNIINAGDSLTFTATANPGPGRSIVEYVWTYDDGCYGTGPQPQSQVTKSFPAPSFNGLNGSPYQVHVTAIDDAGNAGFTTVPITVLPVGGRPGPGMDTKHRAAKSSAPKQGAARKAKKGELTKGAPQTVSNNH